MCTAVHLSCDGAALTSPSYTQAGTPVPVFLPAHWCTLAAVLAAWRALCCKPQGSCQPFPAQHAVAQALG